jgi:hypothetical protein
MENIIEKLSKLSMSDDAWNNWTLEEKRKLLELYYIISQKETQIFNLIYRFHGFDTYESIFRDYDPQYLQDKIEGVEEAIYYIDEYNKK